MKQSNVGRPTFLWIASAHARNDEPSATDFRDSSSVVATRQLKIDAMSFNDTA